MSNNHTYCLNCDQALKPDNSYCPTCGVKAEFHELKLSEIFKRFFESFLNVEYKLLRSIRDIWIPNRILNKFLSGKRNTYVHPFRFFFITTVLFFALSAFLYNKSISDDRYKSILNAGEANVLYKLDSIKAHIDDNNHRILLDSIYRHLSVDIDSSRNKKGEIWGVSIVDDGITNHDIYNLSNEEIVAKYSDKDSYFHGILTKQYVKFLKNIHGATRFMIGNMLWGIVLFTFLCAFCLKLLYFRHRSFYVEHVLQVTHINSLGLILLSINMIIYNFNVELGRYATFIILVLINIYALLSLKNYYHENLLKTFIKVMLLVLLNVLILLFVILCILGLSFFIF
ncbi:DUF3667 domain-containing protein [Saprospiraceae bacterium]|nr:DUF3667 domain-containing protein [Saprospiraceae bacterium]